MDASTFQLQLNESRLSVNNSAPRSSDNSFDQKLRSELERFGLAFLPFTFTAPSVNLFADIPRTEPASSPTVFTDETNISKHYSEPSLSPAASQSYLRSASSPANQSSAPLFNQIRSLLLKTDWLVPNLQMQAPFYQAFLQGSLLTGLDLDFLVDQIVSQLKMVKEKGKTELTLGLKPEELGEIIMILTSRAGVVSIEIQAKDEARKQIEARLEELKAALKKAKIDLGEITIKGVARRA